MRVARLRSLDVLAVVILATAQLSFGWATRGIDPKRDYLDPAPSQVVQDVLAFGDAQFLHRMFALEVQSAGDTGGRIVPLKNYDFSRVVAWLDVLGRLDSRSGFAVEMAGYFGQSQDLANVEPVVRFIMRNVAENPEARWKALFNAIYLARHRQQNDALALEVALQLASYDFEGLDPWAALTPAFILEDMGRYREAIDVVRATKAKFTQRLSADDATWTDSYIDFLLQVEAGKQPPRRPALSRK